MSSDSITIGRASPPSRDVFYEQYVVPNKPVILTGLIDGWPARSLWSASHFGEAYGDVVVSVAGTQRDGALDLDLERGLNYRETPLREYVASMQEVASSGQYVIAETSRFPERFRRELVVPEYCRGAPWLRSKLWFGSKGTVTQMHRGAPENLYCVVRGWKRFIMFPPAETSRVYPHPLLSRLPNFSPVDPEQPDYARFPRFRGLRAWVADLHDGDVLFIPRLWWHHVRTVESTIAVNFWWARGYTIALAAAAHLYKRIRGLST
jgi:hypothetical protein